MLLLEQQKAQQHQQQQQQQQREPQQRQQQQKANKKNSIVKKTINKNTSNECARIKIIKNKLNKKRNFNKKNKILKEVISRNNWMPATIVNVQRVQRLEEADVDQGEKQEKRKETKQLPHHNYQHHHYHHHHHHHHHHQQHIEREQQQRITKFNKNLCTKIRTKEQEVTQQQEKQQQNQQHKQQEEQYNYHKYQVQHNNQQHYQQHRQNGAKNTTYKTPKPTTLPKTTSRTSKTKTETTTKTIINPIERASERISRASTNTKAARRVATTATTTRTTRFVIIIMTLVFSIISNKQQQQQQQQQQHEENLSWFYGIYTAAATVASTAEVESTQQIPTATYFFNNTNTEYHNLVSSSIEEKVQVSIKQPQSKPQTSETTNHTFKSLAFIDDGRLNVVASTTMAKVEQQSVEALPIFDFGMPRNITGRTGHSEALIKCRVDKLNDKSVSWIRKRDLHILTVATATYTSDKRFEVTESKDSREWTLHVKAPQTRDSGIYECQVNTEPKMSMAFQLNIIETSPDAKAIISGPPDLHFKVGSAIILNCVVQQPSSVKDIGPIYWYRGEHMITPFDDADDDDDDAANTNDVDDGGTLPAKPSKAVGAEHNDLMTNDILVHQQKDFAARIAMESQLGDTLKSRLRISNAQTMDTGNYTCQPTTANSASVMVHVINDENPAAMQKSKANALFRKASSSSLEGVFLIEILQLLLLLVPVLRRLLLLLLL